MASWAADRPHRLFACPFRRSVWVEGGLRVEGDVRLFGGRLDFRHLDGQDFAVPLHIRRTGDPGPGARALQISLGPDTQSNNRLAVGPLKTDKTLDEKSVVLSNGNVGIGTANPLQMLTFVVPEGNRLVRLSLRVDLIEIIVYEPLL